MSFEFIEKNQREFTKQAEKILQSKIFNDQVIKDEIIRIAKFSSNDIILDLACGPGIMTEAISPLVAKICAVDVTSKMVELCRERHLKNVQTIQSPAEKLPFKDNMFDVVVTRLAIHHFENPEVVIREIKRVLKDNGKIIIADVYSSNNIDEAQLHNSLEFFRDPSHSKMLSLNQFKELFLNNSLIVQTEEKLAQNQEFNQWLAIVDDYQRKRALECIIKNLIECGKKAGINLQINDKNKILFTHHWVIYKLGVKY
ncbi:class I SAM-dependent methyltransferase [Lentisphaerota bacterium WC36G]|nr:class I SAM-dependent methyltransferase [Lentisphaerae bacterium WC36]